MDMRGKTYINNQLDAVLEGHDWNYSINVQFVGTKNKSNFISIDSREEFEAIRDTMTKNETPSRNINFKVRRKNYGV